jgi:hypothetical protein
MPCVDRTAVQFVLSPRQHDNPLRSPERQNRLIGCLWGCLLPLAIRSSILDKLSRQFRTLTHYLYLSVRVYAAWCDAVKGSECQGSVCRRPQEAGGGTAGYWSKLKSKKDLHCSIIRSWRPMVPCWRQELRVRVLGSEERCAGLKPMLRVPRPETSFGPPRSNLRWPGQ